ncbi:MAG: 1-deoxy-D-xylulose-5-phosphate reductoisomerase [Sneathiella sp.]|nr:1-deoxy-D-xylulose-5-phosphate reductoisomerase [Sneathiella sp.]
MTDVAEIDIKAGATANGVKRVSILGSTGSVGCSTIRLIEEAPDAFDIAVLTAHSNATELAKQAKALDADIAVIADQDKYQELKDLLQGTSIEVAAGEDALIEAAAEPVDWTMSAIVGAAGLAPTLSSIKTGQVVALANKEALVCAGDIVMAEVAKKQAHLLPVDSEHNAIFQVFEQDQLSSIERIILTASGGPFHGKCHEFMAFVTPDQALAHPNWDMGAKISIDSATMMNKGLELIEAYHLFPVEKDQIDIIVHPQSVVHSMVEYGDGSVLAQMGSPDMRTPISYALGWPDRYSFKAERLDLAKISSLTFFEPDETLFPALRLAREALTAGGGAPAILNAANEIAVSAFLKRKIGFLEIATIVDKVLQASNFGILHNIDDVMAADAWARSKASSLI